MNISQLLEQAQFGDLDTCRECPLSPKHNMSIAFGTSCTDHGLDWRKESLANSIFIARDPANTTPQKTGRLCIVHNAENSTDKTAQNSLDLWKAAVSLNAENTEASEYIKKNYWVNSIMHGVTGKAIMETARKHCSKVLQAQIQMLRPKVVIAAGTEAVNSLYDIGLISRDWQAVRLNFHYGAYMEKNCSWIDDKSMSVYCTYHTSAGNVNRTIPPLYKPFADDIEQQIKKKVEANKLDNQDLITAFLSKYHNTSYAPHQGMRYLLNHWLDIGVGIRTAYKDAT